jgi:hypothetical protein
MTQNPKCGRCKENRVDVGEGVFVCPHCDDRCDLDECESCVRSSKGTVPKRRK